MDSEQRLTELQDLQMRPEKVQTYTISDGTLVEEKHDETQPSAEGTNNQITSKNIEYPTKVNLIFITLSLCLVVFLVGLVRSAN